MNLTDEIRQQIEKCKDLKLDIGEINHHLGILEGLVRKDIMERVDDAYQRGLEEGKKATFALVADASNAEYQRGLDDAWECGKKLAWTAKYGGYGERLNDVFGRDDAFDFYDYTPNEAIEKLKSFEQKQDDKIEVGDEVETQDGKRFIVTTFGSGLDSEIAVGVCTDGLGLGVDLKELRKTGRHFDIEKILEAMKHD